MRYNTAQDLDGNRRTIVSNEAFTTRQLAWTFATLTTGAIGEHTLFNVTGHIMFTMVGFITTDLSGGATISVGVEGETSGFAEGSTTDNWEAGEIFVESSGEGAEQTASGSATYVVGFGKDIVYEITNFACTGGVIDWFAFWRPLSTDGNLVAATPA